MLDSLFFGVLGIAVLLSVLTAADRDEIAWPVLAFLAWLICSVGVSGLERVYAFADSEGNTIEHTITYSGGAFMMWFFLGFAIVFVIFFFNRVLAMFREAGTQKPVEG